MEEREKIATAQLLRELAEELLAAEGAERNGLFLELHRLQDTLFRRALQSHPEAPAELAAQAFATRDALPAPQVVRELQGLDASLITPPIRRLYKHMNAARNNMAHEAVLERVTVSRRNSKSMAQLARLLADQLDPAQQGQPRPVVPEARASRHGWQRVLWVALVGMLVGLALGWGLAGVL